MRYVVAILIALVMFFPLYWMAVTSVQTIGGVMRMPPAFIPREVTAKNYALYFDKTPWLIWARNTLIVVGSSIVLSVVITAMAGYAFSVFSFKGKTVFYWALIWSIMITRYALLIPLFVINVKLGVYGLAAAILPVMLDPVGIVLFKAYCDTIPRSLIDSARLDGAGELAVLWRIVAPLCKPIIGALVVFRSVFMLSDYIWQMLVLTNRTEWTLLIGFYQSMYNLSTLAGMKNIGVEAACGMLLLVPFLAIYAVASRYFVGGLTMGGVKE